jgi:hypothetical protein
VDNLIKDEIGDVNDWDKRNGGALDQKISVNSSTVIQPLFTVQKFRM